MKTQFLQAPPVGKWYLLDVIRKGRGRTNDWAALLINVPPAQHQRENDPHERNTFKECWLDVGRCKSRDLAWDVAEARVSAHH